MFSERVGGKRSAFHHSGEGLGRGAPVPDSYLVPTKGLEDNRWAHRLLGDPRAK